MIVLPSAESLGTMVAEAAAGGGQKAIAVEKILAEALHGGAGNDALDAILAHLPNDGSGENPALAALATPYSGDVSGWDMGAAGGLSATSMTNIAVDMAVFHHDAVQPAING